MSRTEIRITGLLWRRAHGNENDLRPSDCRPDIRCEGEATLLLILLYHCREARFINRRDAFLQGGYLFLIDIDTGNRMPHICQTGTGYQANVTGSDNTDFHVNLLWSFIIK